VLTTRSDPKLKLLGVYAVDCALPGRWDCDGGSASRWGLLAEGSPKGMTPATGGGGGHRRRHADGKGQQCVREGQLLQRCGLLAEKSPKGLTPATGGVGGSQKEA